MNEYYLSMTALKGNTTYTIITIRMRIRLDPTPETFQRNMVADTVSTTYRILVLLVIGFGSIIIIVIVSIILTAMTTVGWTGKQSSRSPR